MKTSKFSIHGGMMGASKVVMGMLLLGVASQALADTGMPWDSPLCGFATALRGPTGIAISTIAFFAAGAAFLWGEEISGISKKLVTIFIGVAALLGSASLVTYIALKMGAASTVCGA